MKSKIVISYFFCLFLFGSFTVKVHDTSIVEVAHLEFPNQPMSDVWGYVDEQTQKPYALAGTFNGLYVIDVSKPSSPTVVGYLPDTPGFDVKVWKNYAYGVTGSSGEIGHIVDLTDPTNPLVVATFESAHNIWIDEKGYLYAEVPGLTIYDLNEDPTKPKKIWHGGKDDAGHDAINIGNLLVSFHARAGTFLYDITDRTHPQLLAEITDPAIIYHHHGWITEDGNYLYITDEGATSGQADITVWDISDLSNPEKKGAIAYPKSTVHNIYIIGKYAYISYYNDGFRILDISNPLYSRYVADFKINDESGEGYSGAFGAYPFTESGFVYVTGSSAAKGEVKGLFYIFDVSKSVQREADQLPEKTKLRVESYPNPFDEAVNIELFSEHPKQYAINIYDLQGRFISEVSPLQIVQGKKILTWKPEGLASGTYIAHIQTPTGSQTKLLIFRK